MLTPGLISVTFRKKSPAEIVELVKQAKLKGIDWGGDIHVPHGDLPRAKEVRQITLDAGLHVSGYASYYKLSTSEKEGLPFEKVLETALALGAPSIRIWPGPHASAQTPPEEWAACVENLQKIAPIAAAQKVNLALEFHEGTPTDSLASSLRLLNDAAVPNVGIHWQPRPEWSEPERLESLRGVLPHLANVHVFSWIYPGQRNPLALHIDRWPEYFKIANPEGSSRWTLMEFVKGESAEQFLEDAALLHQLLQPYSS